MRKTRIFFLCGVILAAALMTPWTKAGAQEGRAGVPVRYGPFEVEVLVHGRPLEALFGRGRRYVEAVEGAEYEVLIRNPLPVRVAVALSVDGLNTIDARRSSSWDASKWVIEPYQSIRLSGWQMSSRHARRFYFTTERDSYAARLGRRSDLGLITAVFYREAATRVVPVVPHREESERHAPRPETQSRGEDSPREMSKSDRAGRGAGVVRPPRDDDEHAATGIGRAVDHQVTFIDMRLERRSAAEVTIRYEYRDALVRLGLLPRPTPYGDDVLHRRERARGFEDPRFCPEP
jgi:hypothetical protein